MPVLVIASHEREDGYTAVTLSQDGVRFEALVSTDVARSDHAYNLYQMMADGACARQAETLRLAALRLGD